MSDTWRPIYDVLVGIRNDLEKLSLTQAWSLRETDLYDFQRQLDKIDESRRSGNFLDDKGRPADLWTQRTMLYLIRRSYAYIYSFMLASEPVSEALLPIYNQLQTLKRCLIEVKNNGGVSSVRELYPYSMKVSNFLFSHCRQSGTNSLRSRLNMIAAQLAGQHESRREVCYQWRYTRRPG